MKGKRMMEAVREVMQVKQERGAMLMVLVAVVKVDRYS